MDMNDKLNFNEFISDELLAAYLDGNTTDEENNRIQEILQFSDEYSEIIDVAYSALDYEFKHKYAASLIDRNGLCCILSEKFILNKKGIDIPENVLLEIATENGWFFSQKGTPPMYIGKLLEHYKLSIKRKFGACVEDLIKELKAGHFVIAYIDGGELTGDLILEMMEDTEIGKIPDHVVIVADIDPNDTRTVTLRDFSTENDLDRYPIEQFMDSWADSKFYMISVE